MNSTRIRRGLVVLVVLLLGLSLVAPVAVATGPHDGDTTTGDSFGDDLTGSSSSDTTDGSDGDASSGSSDDGSLSDSDSDSSDDGSLSDSDSDSDSDDDGSLSNADSDSDSESGDDGSLSDSDSSDDGSLSDSDSDSNDDGMESDDETLLGSTTEELSLEERLSALATGSTDEESSPVSGSADGVSSLDGGTVSEADLVDVNTVSSPTDTSYEVELVDLASDGTALLEVTASGATTDGLATTAETVGDTVAASSDRFTTGASGTTDATGDTARVESTGPVAGSDDAAAVDSGSGSGSDAPDAGSGSNSDALRNAIGGGVPVSGDDLPGGPAGAGAVVGLAGAAAAVAARQSGAFSGMGGSLATTTRTAAASVPGTGHLDRLVRMLAPFRYSRYDDSDPLEHEAREAMFEVVEDSPGTYLSEIADRAGIPLSTARHHIRVLEREDLVSGAKVRGKRRFYPAHTEGVELAAAMNDDSTAAVIDALARLGAASVSDLADELGKDPSTVTHHVQRLEEDEVVVRERDGRAVMNKLTAAARTMLEPDERAAGPAAAGEAMASD
ncbi:winged helix-turn-helix transcriptional regulator [Haloglomus litoreum]|uniref:winged helix-turn-helix transcriptional regulator n=1 Tax=Haloglomus litoreum TaxID=3034026 RepID=UPI0023E79AC9|nr:helix-turn-helix domain-containing protein [Haloglomus sp. DT116]